MDAEQTALFEQLEPWKFEAAEGQTEEQALTHSAYSFTYACELASTAPGVSEVVTAIRSKLA